jgi:hypothetical protein
MRNQRARNKNKAFTLPGSDAEQAATSKQNGISQLREILLPFITLDIIVDLKSV